MKRVRWTKHALEGLGEREIDRQEVEEAVRRPTAMAPGRNDRTMFLRRYHDRLHGQEMLLCVVAEGVVDEVVIVTIFKTSKIQKYLKEGA